MEGYPDDMLDAVEPAREHFRGLSPCDQADAVRLLPVYLAEYARRKRKGLLVGRLRWLRERRWEGPLRAEAPRAANARGAGDGPAASAGDPDPVLEFPGGFKRRESFVVEAVARWRERPASWPVVELGAPPGAPGCRVPRRLLADAPTRAREPAGCGT